ncbi:MAG TPA: acyl-CoA dehydrogenase family protein, partial [Acidimicrobiales bacterium]|nr:acyl-CoA dehydrogenase family protein [Acidimicrobiales bacterium]
MTPPTLSDPLATARTLCPLIDSEAAATESGGTLSPAVVDAFRESGMFWLLVPAVLGGTEADAVTTLEVFEELSRADASTGWTLLANTTTSGFAGAFCDEAAVKTMFGGSEMPVHGGMLGPRGRAVPAEGGFRVSGNYSFGSGTGHSDWVGAGTMVMGENGPLTGESGLPEMRVAFLPRDAVRFLGNWDVLGLVGTGSYDYAVDDVFVDEGFTFPLIGAEIRRGGPVYRLGVLGLTSIGHCGFALGVGRRALEEVAKGAPGKVRMSGLAPVADDPVFRHDFAFHEAALRSARAYAFEIFGAAMEQAEAGRDPDLEVAQRLRQATTYATRVAVDVVRASYGWLGTDGIRPSVLQRCLRDIETA